MVVVTFACRSVKKCTGGDSRCAKRAQGVWSASLNVKIETAGKPLRMTDGIVCALMLVIARGLAQGPTQGLPSLPSRDAGPKARVVVVHDANATEAFSPNPERVIAMVNQGITNLSGKPTPMDAWLSLVSTQDVVGIKVFSAPGPNSGTRPAVVEAVVKGLLASGLPSSNLIVWDKQLIELRLAGYIDLAKRYHIRSASSAQVGYDEDVFYDNPLIGNLTYNDHEFELKGPGVGRKSFVSKLLTRQITKIISITPLLNHNDAGVSGNLLSLAFGSVDNVARFESNPERLSTAVPEIYGLTNLCDRVALNIVDALICQYEGSERGLLHYSSILNQLRFSKDPVALDVLSLQDLQRQRQATDAPATRTNLELYFNASLLELGVSDLKRIQVDKLECR